jgi:hypothetical protein
LIIPNRQLAVFHLHFVLTADEVTPYVNGNKSSKHQAKLLGIQHKKSIIYFQWSRSYTFFNEALQSLFCEKDDIGQKR